MCKQAHVASQQKQATACPLADRHRAAANACFAKIIAEAGSTAHGLSCIKGLCCSLDATHRAVGAQMIQSLFDQIDLVHLYPERELLIIAALFGGVIGSHLVDDASSGSLTTALHCVLDSCKHPPGSARFRFGTLALQQFTARLAEWPHYTCRLLRIPHLRVYAPELMHKIILSVSKGEEQSCNIFSKKRSADSI